MVEEADQIRDGGVGDLVVERLSDDEVLGTRARDCHEDCLPAGCNKRAARLFVDCLGMRERPFAVTFDPIVLRSGTVV